MLRRIGLFMLVNIAIMVMLNIVINILGLNNYITSSGLNYPSLMLFCLFWGMGGAFISLLISKRMAIWTMRLRILDENSYHQEERRLVQTVHRLAQSANLSKMPTVAIYDSPEVNAFATGPSKSNSLVAVSTGLLSSMSSQEVDGVLGHEISHIANGDMVTMTLLQGVLNAFVMFFAKVLAWAVASALNKSSDEDSRPSFFLTFAIEMVLQIVFGIGASLVVAWFSRFREYRADAGGANLAGKAAMIRALQRLQSVSQVEVDDSRSQAMQNFKISGGKSNFLALFATHPPLSDRIRALQESP